MKKSRTTWTPKLKFAAALTPKERKMLKGYRFEPTGDGSACYPTLPGSYDKPELPLILNWQEHIILNDESKKKSFVPRTWIDSFIESRKKNKETKT